MAQSVRATRPRRVSVSESVARQLELQVKQTRNFNLKQLGVAKQDCNTVGILTFKLSHAARRCIHLATTGSIRHRIVRKGRQLSNAQTVHAPRQLKPHAVCRRYGGLQQAHGEMPAPAQKKTKGGQGPVGERWVKMHRAASHARLHTSVALGRAAGLKASRRERRCSAGAEAPGTTTPGRVGGGRHLRYPHQR